MKEEIIMYRKIAEIGENYISIYCLQNTTSIKDERSGSACTSQVRMDYHFY